MMAWERQRRLQDKHSYLLELEKVKNFSWDDWRKRVSIVYYMILLFKKDLTCCDFNLTEAMSSFQSYES